MSKQTQATQPQHDKKHQPKIEPHAPAKAPDELAGMAQLPGGSMAALEDGSIEGQAARLADPRLLTAQSRAMATQIGRVQGNRHLQRVVASLPDHRPAPLKAVGNKAPAPVQLKRLNVSPQSAPTISRQEDEESKQLEPALAETVEQVVKEMQYQLSLPQAQKERLNMTVIAPITNARNLIQDTEYIGDLKLAHKALSGPHLALLTFMGAARAPELANKQLEKAYDQLGNVQSYLQGSVLDTLKQAKQQLNSVFGHSLDIFMNIPIASTPAGTDTDKAAAPVDGLALEYHQDLSSTVIQPLAAIRSKAAGLDGEGKVAEELIQEFDNNLPDSIISNFISAWNVSQPIASRLRHGMHTAYQGYLILRGLVDDTREAKGIIKIKLDEIAQDLTNIPARTPEPEATGSAEARQQMNGTGGDDQSGQGQN